MNDVPPSRDPPEDFDEYYRRVSRLDPSRPSESVRRTVLNHATQLAAGRTAGRPRGRPPLGGGAGGPPFSARSPPPRSPDCW